MQFRLVAEGRDFLQQPRARGIECVAVGRMRRAVEHAREAVHSARGVELVGLVGGPDAVEFERQGAQEERREQNREDDQGPMSKGWGNAAACGAWSLVVVCHGPLPDSSGTIGARSALRQACYFQRNIMPVSSGLGGDQRWIAMVVM
jgi:hypothetical protein